jgi:hypothetical protein
VSARSTVSTVQPAPSVLAGHDPPRRGILAGFVQCGACACRKPCHPMRPVCIRGSGRRAGPGGEPGR